MPGARSAAMPAPEGTQPVTASTLVVYAPRDAVIDRFYGDGGVSETERFLTRIQRAWESPQFASDRAKVNFLFDHVGESVEKEIICTLSGAEPSPNQLVKIIQSCYGEKRSMPALIRELYNIKQRRGEGIRQFSLRLQDAYNSVRRREETEAAASPIGADTLRDIFIENLADKAIRRELRQSLKRGALSTFKDARIQAMELEDDPAESDRGHDAGVRHITSAPPPSECTHTQSIKALTDQVARLTGLVERLLMQGARNLNTQSQKNTRASASRRRDQNLTGAVCFNCGRHGHFARVCHAVSGNQRVSPAPSESQDRWGRARERPMQPHLDTRGTHVGLRGADYGAEAVGLHNTIGQCHVADAGETAATSTLRRNTAVGSLSKEEPGLTLAATSCGIDVSIAGTVGVDNRSTPPPQVVEAMIADYVTDSQRAELRGLVAESTDLLQREKPRAAAICEPQIGGKVLLRQHPPGRNKIQDKFGEETYQLTEVPNSDSGPAVVAPCGDLTNTRRVTFRELRPLVGPARPPQQCREELSPPPRRPGRISSKPDRFGQCKTFRKF
ncbi:hypothetical protein EGW08_023108 [Elysia chlorotica]|uniref:CCHC-type domain-containing protein n=1 Tax=Elysia chlorotica TaxID=188477 RepID=A0A3S1AQH0_ELYCH|nr:hypothetical protein EGW08_023108 [Elysia chlorotica]